MLHLRLLLFTVSNRQYLRVPHISYRCRAQHSAFSKQTIKPYNLLSIGNRTSILKTRQELHRAPYSVPIKMLCLNLAFLRFLLRPTLTDAWTEWNQLLLLQQIAWLTWATVTIRNWSLVVELGLSRGTFPLISSQLRL
jgi:hypothetical protein